MINSNVIYPPVAVMHLVLSGSDRHCPNAGTTVPRHVPKYPKPHSRVSAWNAITFREATVVRKRSRGALAAEKMYEGICWIVMMVLWHGEAC